MRPVPRADVGDRPVPGQTRLLDQQTDDLGWIGGSPAQIVGHAVGKALAGVAGLHVSPLMYPRLHPSWQRETQKSRQRLQSAHKYLGGGEAGLAKILVGLLQNRMAVVDGVELLCQLQSVPCE